MDFGGHYECREKAVWMLFLVLGSVIFKINQLFIIIHLFCTFSDRYLKKFELFLGNND